MYLKRLGLEWMPKVRGAGAEIDPKGDCTNKHEGGMQTCASKMILQTIEIITEELQNEGRGSQNDAKRRSLKCLVCDPF